MHDIITEPGGSKQLLIDSAPLIDSVRSELSICTLPLRSGMVIKGYGPPKLDLSKVEGVLPVTTLPIEPILQTIHLLNIFPPWLSCSQIY